MEKELRAQLNALAQKQADLQRELRRLGEQSRSVDSGLRRLFKLAEAQEKKEALVPPPLPAQRPAPAAAEPENRKEEPAAAKPEPAVEREPVVAKTTNPSAPKPRAGEWELDFGRVWLVRIGILLLLTGLVFLSTYAYKNWLFNAGAGAKVAFFMAISLTLTGLGTWLEKRRERFQQYGRVLASGGLAAGYYTIYASHFTPSLKLLESTVLAGLLLTLWAGVMLAYAVWKRSRVVAVMAIGLAFYGTVVNPAGWLSLFSALLLSCAGLWLMLRFKWMAIGIGTMAAAYVSHAFWLGGGYPQAVGDTVRFTYLACYWVLFTAALAVPQAQKIPVRIQRVFCAVNNLAAWQLAVFLIPEFSPRAQTGWISIGAGLLWLALAAVAHRRKLWHRALVPIFAYQGVLVATFGLLLESTGYTRFLLLAVEACLLLLRARGASGQLLRWVSGGVFACALVTAVPALVGGGTAGWQSYAALALVCAVYTGMLQADARRAATVWSGEFAKLAPVLAALATWLVAGFGVFGQWSVVSGVNGLWCLATAVALFYLLTNKPRWIAEVALTAMVAAMAGAVWFAVEYRQMVMSTPLLPVLGAGAFWYLAPRITAAWDILLADGDGPRAAPSRLPEWLFSLSFWAMAAVTLSHHMDSPKSWLVLGGVLALAGNAAGEYTRRASIAVPALLFHFFGFAALTFYGTQAPLVGWTPAVLVLAHLSLADLLWVRLNQKTMRVLLALGLFATAAMHSFQELDRPDMALAALGAGMTAWAYVRKSPGFAMAGGVPPLAAACLTAAVMHGAQDWPRYLSIAATLAVHAQLWRKTKANADWKPARVILAGAGLACLFLTASVHVWARFHGAGLAICWALLAAALFSAGLCLRCRPYRLVGLFWLAAAVLHVVCIDVMRLETLGRILSFITLGVVLLALGFLYNRYQETIRNFL